MGNEESKLTNQSKTDFCSIERVEVNVEVRYRGTFKQYQYISKEYGILLDPSNTVCPVSSYDPAHWEGVSNPRTIIQVKRSLLILAKDFLEAKDILLNEIQKTLAVN
jgi:hypothetical protein